MAKKVKGGEVKFKVTADGLNKVGKDAKNAGNNFNTLDKNARSTDRAMKGVSNMSSNTTKNFSKMSQGITGGLVPAYATLAAQLFAIDALFRFLKEAADYRVLMEGQEAFAAATGRAMKTISREIQAATEAQITFKEASQATAIGLAAGLTPGQLKELGESAKIVSVALGRDVTDSFNRLVRGVTKAEPELLDELGIILRLEEASVRYAAALGLNKNQLTTFQKSQAVANEVLRQSEERYGAIADMLGEDSVNQLSKLAIAFDEVLNNVRRFIGPLAEFFGEFLVQNIESATAAMGVFAATITGGLIRGAMPQIDTRGAANQIQENLGGLLTKGKKGSAQRARRDRILSGTGTEADIATYQRAIDAKTTKLLKFENVSRAEAKRTFNLLKLQRQQMVVESAQGFARMKANFVMELYTMEAEHGKVMGRMKFGFMQLGKAASGLMRVLGYLGMAVMIFQMAKGAFEWMMGTDKTLESLEQKTEQLTSTQKQLNEELLKTAKVFEKDLFSDRSQEIEAIGNAFQSADLVNRVTEYNTMFKALGGSNEKVVELKNELQTTFQTLGKFDARFSKFGDMLSDPSLLNAATGEMRKLSMEYVAQGQAVKSLQEATANYNKQLNRYIQAIPKVPYQDVLMSQEQMRLSLEQLRDATGNTAEETAEYQRQLDILAGTTKVYTLLSESQLKVQLAMQRVQQTSAQSTHALFGDKEAVKRASDTANAMTKMFEAQIAVFQAEENLRKAGTDTEIAIREQQLKLAREMEDTTLNQLAAVAAMENVFFRVNKQIMTGLTDELGKSLGKALRGEKGAFADFGKKLANTLTDQVGKKLAENIMKITYGGTPLDPRYQQENFKNSLKESFKEGFTNSDSPLQMGGTAVARGIGNAMIDAANAHITGLHNAKVGLARADLLQKNMRVEDQQDLITKYESFLDGSRLATIEGQRDKNRQDIVDKENEIDLLGEKIFGNYMQQRALQQEEHGYDSAPEMGKKIDILKDNPEYLALLDELNDLKNISSDLSTQTEEYAQQLSIAEQEIGGARLALELLEEGAGKAANTLKDIEGSAPTDIPGLVTPNEKGTDDDDKSPKKKGTPITADPNTFAKKASDLFPGLMDAAGGTDTFGGNVLTFGTAVTQFATLTAQGLAIAGKNEEAADIMLEVAKIQMALAMAEFATSVADAFGRYGGVMSHAGRSFSQGGVADGPNSGYNATLHGTEAVVPLGNDRSIPVKLDGAAGTNNVNVTVNVDQNGGSETLMTGDGARELGKTIAAIAQDTIAKEQRAGGLLSSI